MLEVGRLYKSIEKTVDMSYACMINGMVELDKD